MKKSITIIFGLLVIASMLLSACQPAPAEVITKTVIVTEIVEKEGETIIETQIIEVIVTPEPEPGEVELTGTLALSRPRSIPRWQPTPRQWM